MPKPTILKTWIEMSQTFLHDGPPKREDWEAAVFVNRCELRKASRDPYLLRNTGVEFIRASTKERMEEKVSEFALRDDVRLLAKGIQSNDFDTLPKREDEPAPDVIDGTADIYADKESIDA